MSSEGEQNEIDIDRMVEDLKAGAAKAAKLSESLHEEPELDEDSGDQLIASVAENLATIRRASGLPDKSAGEFEASMKQLRQQKLS